MSIDDEADGCRHVNVLVGCCQNGCATKANLRFHQPRGASEPCGFDLPDGWMAVPDTTSCASFLACGEHAEPMIIDAKMRGAAALLAAVQERVR